MKLVEGVHHVTFLTEDIDRLATFYERVLEARKTLDMAEEGITPHLPRGRPHNGKDPRLGA
jgi:catechol 2,3-dioxygenase-like lactoylglutathione lyase family enzyme